MEYFAKSPTKILSMMERKALIDKVHEVRAELENELSEKEIAILAHYETDLKKEQSYEHKTLAEHLDEIVKCAEEFFALYGDYFTDKEKKLILMACKEHDVGKANYIFQTKVNPQLGHVKISDIPHGFLSALCLNKGEFEKNNPDCTKEDFSVLLTAIYFHHNRKDIYDEKYFESYFQEYYLEHVRTFKEDESLSFRKTFHRKLLFSNNNKFNYRSISNETVWHEYILVKGLLNKFDWTVSAGYDVSEMEPDRNKKLCNSIKNQIQDLRPAQEFMQSNSDKNVVVIAPTGSGKTEAALLWLNGEKGFYTLPLKVSSNAIYKRVKERYQFENIALLHSDSMSIYLKESDGSVDDGYKSYEQAKLLSYPLTVCTVDQLFKFVYKALGTEIFGATLKYSKVIIDEIQSYSPNIVAALIYGLSVVNKMGGKFAIITATFPPVLKYFMEKCNLIENTDYIFENFSNAADYKRHKIHIVDGPFDIDELVEKSYSKKVLVICNTVSKAQNLYEEIRDKCENIGLLHSRFIRKHREMLENEIMAFSNDEKATGIWITTQIVEASLDIDFDVLYTEMCTADSLLQRMGRCNRAGKKSTDEPNIFIFKCGTPKKGKYDGIYDKDIYERSVEFLKPYEGKIFTETDKNSFINAVYDTEQIKKTAYYEEIEKNIEKFKETGVVEYTLDDANEDFRGIHSVTVMPDSIYNKNNELIDGIDTFLKIPNLHKGVRKILKAKITSLTLEVNLINKKKYPENVDYAAINDTLDIHRANLKYDFDEETRRGAGLWLNKPEDEVLMV